MKQYTEKHEWIEKIGDNRYRVGITDVAQDRLGDVVSVELPEMGQTLGKDAECGVVESVKTASDIYSPASGEVVAVNDALADNPGLVNEEAENGGWFWEMSIANESELAGLMDEAAYKTYSEAEEH